jgi:N5-(cytidine 5'-diphosphoramidyl)-L-glutamine hydrolase
MNIKIIGITQREEEVISYEEKRDSLDQKLVQWVSDLGMLPVPIPNNLSSDDLFNWLNLLNVDSIILSGGNNIGESKKRDTTENNLLLWAQNNKKPVLGICRGMQMMSVFSGEGLVKISNHVKVRHSLVMSDDSISLPTEVNSFHNYGLRNCPKGYRVLAFSDDGSIEAIAHNELNWEGWMWHPERDSLFSLIEQNRFKTMVFDD